MTLTLRSSRFRAEREDDWRRLERLLARLEKEAPAALPEEDLLAVPVLYRSALSSLSMARSISLDRSLVDYLESLCARAYFVVYGVRSSFLERLAAFFTRGWPRAMRALRLETLVALAVMLAAATVGWLLVWQDSSWYYAFIPESMAAGRDPATATAELAKSLAGEGGDGLGVFATFLFTHNAQVAILMFALGFAFGAPTLLLLAQQGLMLGAILALYAERGLGLQMGGWLFIHGSTELFAVVLAAAAGLRLGRAAAMPGARGRLEALSEGGRVSGVAMGGVVVMLMAAGALEGFGRQLIGDAVARYAVGAGMLLFWLIYYYWPRRGLTTAEPAR